MVTLKSLGFFGLPRASMSPWNQFEPPPDHFCSIHEEPDHRASKMDIIRDPSEKSFFVTPSTSHPPVYRVGRFSIMIHSLGRTVLS